MPEFLLIVERLNEEVGPISHRFHMGTRVELEAQGITIPDLVEHHDDFQVAFGMLVSYVRSIMHTLSVDAQTVLRTRADLYERVPLIARQELLDAGLAISVNGIYRLTWAGVALGVTLEPTTPEIHPRSSDRLLEAMRQLAPIANMSMIVLINGWLKNMDTMQAVCIRWFADHPAEAGLHEVDIYLLKAAIAALDRSVDRKVGVHDNVANSLRLAGVILTDS